MASVITLMVLLALQQTTHCQKAESKGSITCGDTKTDLIPTEAHRYRFTSTSFKNQYQFSTCGTATSFDVALYFLFANLSVFNECNNANQMGTKYEFSTCDSCGTVTKEMASLNLKAGNYFIDVRPSSDAISHEQYEYELKMLCEIAAGPTPTKSPADLVSAHAPTQSIATSQPTASPASFTQQVPTKPPTKVPTASPIKSYVYRPTASPTKVNLPINVPTTPSPTENPTKFPTQNPTNIQSQSPSKTPTKQPSDVPTKDPSKTPTNVPNTVAPTTETCTILTTDNMDTLGKWERISGSNIEIEEPGAPRCDGDKKSMCWKTMAQSYYKRTVSTDGYQKIQLSFHFYAMNLDADEDKVCRISYSSNDGKSVSQLFEDDGKGSMNDINQRKYVSLPQELSNQKFWLYIESTADGGKENNEHCFFDSIEFCGYPKIQTLTPTRVPVTATPTTKSPTGAPTTKSPTMVAGTPTKGGEGEITQSVTDGSVNDNDTGGTFQSASGNNSEVIVIVGIIAGLVAFIVLIAALIYCYRIKMLSKKDNVYSGKEKTEMMNTMHMMNTNSSAAISRVQSLSDAMSDGDVVDGIVHTNMSNGDFDNNGESEQVIDVGRKDSDDLLYEGYTGTITISNVQLTPQTPGGNVDMATPAGNDTTTIENEMDDEHEDDVYEQGNETVLDGEEENIDGNVNENESEDDDGLYGKGNKTEK